VIGPDSAPYRRWALATLRRRMTLDRTTMYCAARIIGDDPYVSRGKFRTRGVQGTGFFVTVPSETLPNVRHTYLVTANHVIEGQTNVEVQVPDPLTGRLAKRLAVSGWQQPFDPVDLALAPVHRRPFANRISIRLQDQVLGEGKRPLYPGSIVYYVGHLTPLDRVMARSGTIGALDQGGLPLDEYSYLAHLVDCRSYRGFSGSPCFVDIPYAMVEPIDYPLPLPLPEGVGPVADLVHMTLLCGMFTTHLTDQSPDGTASRYGVGVMLRSEEIRAALMTDGLREERADRDAEYGAEAAE
jgi:hypothetical protein